MINGQEMNMALGLDVYLSGFSDGVPRRCYPYKMRDLNKINSYLSFINEDDFDLNFQRPESIRSIQELFSDSFRDENGLPLPDDGMTALLKAVNNENFKELIKDIKTLNGFRDNSGERIMDTGDEDTGIDWETSVSAILVYTSNSVKDILEMTFPQFNDCLLEIGKKINWEYKTDTLGLVEKPDEHIGEEDHPLSKRERTSSKKRMTMKDLQGMTTGS